jgi:predicted TIM-barrel fold metal-dependent hydrolase
LTTVHDVQHHYVPEPLARRLGHRPGGEPLAVRHEGRRKFTLHDRLVDLDLHLEAMDAAGIDVAVLSSLAGWDASADDCRLINADMRRTIDRYGGRFDAFAHLPTHDSADGIAELERATQELGLRGLTLISEVNGRALDDRSLDWLYERAEAAQLPIFVHPTMAVVSHRYAADEFDLGRILGRELDLQTAVARVIAGGVLDRFPELRLIFAHLGGGIAAVKERLVKKSFRFGIEGDFDHYFDKLYFDMAGFEGGMGALRCALTGIEPSRLVFATDYPQDFTGTATSGAGASSDMARYVADVRALDLPNGSVDAMLGGTAEALLGGRARAFVKDRS